MTAEYQTMIAWQTQDRLAFLQWNLAMLQHLLKLAAGDVVAEFQLKQRVEVAEREIEALQAAIQDDRQRLASEMEAEVQRVRDYIAFGPAKSK